MTEYRVVWKYRGSMEHQSIATTYECAIELANSIVNRNLLEDAHIESREVSEWKAVEDER